MNRKQFMLLCSLGVFSLGAVHEDTASSNITPKNVSDVLEELGATKDLREEKKNKQINHVLKEILKKIKAKL